MPTNDEDRVLEVLADAECRRLLGTAQIGRLGFTDGALPAIVPVPFTVEDHRVRIPAREGNWVLAAVRRSVVAFAVDSYDVVTRTGWGVTIVGPAYVTTGDLRNGTRSIAVQMGLLRGWRLSLPEASACTSLPAAIGT